MDIAIGLCQCGCGRTTGISKKNDSASGRVKGVHSKFISGHSSRILGPDYEVSDSGCWLWIKTIYSCGYGKAHYDGKPIYAHIYYYKKKNGPVPTGLELDHLCRTRRCVNPDHLEAVTHVVNMRRGASCVLKESEVIEIRRLASTGESRTSISRKFPVTPQHIGLIVRGLKYKL